MRPNFSVAAVPGPNRWKQRCVDGNSELVETKFPTRQILTGTKVIDSLISAPPSNRRRDEQYGRFVVEKDDELLADVDEA